MMTSPTGTFDARRDSRARDDGDYDWSVEDARPSRLDTYSYIRYCYLSNATPELSVVRLASDALLYQVCRWIVIAKLKGKKNDMFTFWF